MLILCERLQRFCCVGRPNDEWLWNIVPGIFEVKRMGRYVGSCAIRHPLRNPGVILSLHSRHDGILSCIQRFFYLFLFTCDNPGTAALKENKTIYHIQKWRRPNASIWELPSAQNRFFLGFLCDFTMVKDSSCFMLFPIQRNERQCFGPSIYLRLGNPLRCISCRSWACIPRTC